MESSTARPLQSTQADNSSDSSNTTLCEYPLLEYEVIFYTFVVPVVFGLITLIGILGNSLVIHVILCKQKMRSVTNILLLNLAFADLSFVVICPPFTAYQFVAGDWPFGDVVCKLMHYLLNVTAYVTVYTLVLISAIRYMTIVHNQATKQYRTPQNVVVVICGMWLIMLALNTPVFVSYGVVDICASATCEIYSELMAQRLFGTLFAFAYVLPLTTIGIFSICILCHIQNQRPSTMERRTTSERRKKQASRLIVLVVVIFAVFWLPIHIHLLLAWWSRLPHSRIYDIVSTLWYILAYFNSCVNPIIYNFASREFRDSFREAVCCCGPARWRHSSDSAAHTLTTKEERNGNIAATPAEKQLLVSMEMTENNCSAV